MTATIHHLRPFRAVPTDPRMDAERRMLAADDAWYAHPCAGTLVQFIAAYRDYLTLCRALPYHVAKVRAETEAERRREQMALVGAYRGDPTAEIRA